MLRWKKPARWLDNNLRRSQKELDRAGWLRESERSLTFPGLFAVFKLDLRESMCRHKSHVLHSACYPFLGAILTIQFPSLSNFESHSILTAEF